MFTTETHKGSGSLSMAVSNGSSSKRQGSTYGPNAFERCDRCMYNHCNETGTLTGIFLVGEKGKDPS